MKFVKLLAILAVVQLLFSAAAREKPVRIAVIDMNRVFEKYYKTRIIESKLKKQQEIFTEYASKMVKSLETLRSEFIRLRDDSQNLAFSKAERENRRLNAQEKYRQMTAKEKEIRDYNREKQNQMRDEYEKMRNAILNDIFAVVNSKSLAEGYILVLDKSGRSLNNIPTVVYSSKTLDITESVIKTLNLGQPSGKNQANRKK